MGTWRGLDSWPNISNSTVGQLAVTKVLRAMPTHSLRPHVGPMFWKQSSRIFPVAASKTLSCTVFCMAIFGTFPMSGLLPLLSKHTCLDVHCWSCPQGTWSAWPVAFLHRAQQECWSWPCKTCQKLKGSFNWRGSIHVLAVVSPCFLPNYFCEPGHANFRRISRSKSLDSWVRPAWWNLPQVKNITGVEVSKKRAHHRIFHCKQPSILKVGTPILRTSMMFPSILGQTTIDKQVSRDHVKCVFVLSNCLLQHVLVAHNLRNGYSKSGLNLQSAIYVQLILPGFKDILSFCRLAVSRKHMEIRYWRLLQRQRYPTSIPR